VGQICPLVGPRNLTDLSEMAFVQHVCDSQKRAQSATSFGSNPEWRSSRVLLTKIKHEDHQLAVSAENRVPSQKEKEVLGKVTCNPSFTFWMVAFVSLLPRHWLFPTVCYSISKRLPCSHVHIPLLPITQYTASTSSKHIES